MSPALVFSVSGRSDTELVCVQRQEQENQRSRLDELRRLILTSSNVEDEETAEENAKV